MITGAAVCLDCREAARGHTQRADALASEVLSVAQDLNGCMRDRLLAALAAYHETKGNCDVPSSI